MASTACPIAPHPAGVGESHGAVRVEGDRAVEHAQAILELFGQKGDRVAAHGKRGGIVASLRDRQSSKLDAPSILPLQVDAPVLRYAQGIGPGAQSRRHRVVGLELQRTLDISQRLLVPPPSHLAYGSERAQI